MQKDQHEELRKKDMEALTDYWHMLTGMMRITGIDVWIHTFQDDAGRKEGWHLGFLHYKEETPTVRKWNRIGDSYVRLKSISQHLPPVVSTLYKLSTLDSNKLTSLIDSQILTPSVTLKEIDDELNPTKTTKNPICITLEIDSTVDEDTLQEILDSLDNYKKVIEIKMSQEVKNILNK
jgi:hypothetical protein